MKRTKIRERYTTTLVENTFETDLLANMYRIVPFRLITYQTIKLERHEE